MVETRVRLQTPVQKARLERLKRVKAASAPGRLKAEPGNDDIRLLRESNQRPEPPAGRPTPAAQ